MYNVFPRLKLKCISGYVTTDLKPLDKWLWSRWLGRTPKDRDTGAGGRYLTFEGYNFPVVFYRLEWFPDSMGVEICDMVVDPAYRNKGYGKEALKIITKELLAIPMVMARVMESKKGWVKVNKELGFKAVGRHGIEGNNSDIVDHCIYFAKFKEITD